jgi:hypothetical protein
VASQIEGQDLKSEYGSVPLVVIREKLLGLGVDHPAEEGEQVFGDLVVEIF